MDGPVTKGSPLGWSCVARRQLTRNWFLCDTAGMREDVVTRREYRALKGSFTERSRRLWGRDGGAGSRFRWGIAGCTSDGDLVSNDRCQPAVAGSSSGASVLDCVAGGDGQTGALRRRVTLVSADYAGCPTQSLYDCAPSRRPPVQNRRCSRSGPGVA